MISSRDEARAIALNHLNPDINMQVVNDEWVIIDADTIETRFGWLFHTDSRVHFETGNPHHRVMGSAGIIVERTSGHIFIVPSLGSRRVWMRDYEYQRTHSLFSGFLAILYIITDSILPNLLPEK